MSRQRARKNRQKEKGVLQLFPSNLLFRLAVMLPNLTTVSCEPLDKCAILKM